MNTRFLLNIMMLLVALGLFAAIVLTKKIDQSIHTLSNIDASKVQQITIQHKERTTVLQKTLSGWKIVQPVTIQANEFRISTLLKLLNTTSLARYDSSTLSLEDYGLSNTETRIQFDQVGFDFGINNPMNQLRYVLHNQQVHLIDDTVYPLLTSQLGSLVSPRLLNDNTEITRLILPDSEFWLDENNQWNSRNELGSDAIVETIQHWNNSQAFAVHDYVVREELANITIHSRQHKQPIEFLVTDIDPWLIIARPKIGLEYHFNIDIYDKLLRPGTAANTPEDLSHEIIDVQPDEFLNAINR